MTADGAKARTRFRRHQAQRWMLITGFSTFVAVIIVLPLLMVGLSSGRLPWKRLADIGQAYGGVSALLSAAALCGVVASLLFQGRQVRQELAEMDRQQHIDLMRLALENPEFIEVLDARTAAGPHARQELFANLMMMYWLAVWELGVVDEDELRAMASDMFASEISRRWWGRVGGGWIGTHGKKQRRRFISIVSEELTRARLVPATPVRAVRPGAVPRRAAAASRWPDVAVLAAAVAVMIGALRGGSRSRSTEAT
jgi:hypothetical protein